MCEKYMFLISSFRAVSSHGHRTITVESVWVEEEKLKLINESFCNSPFCHYFNNYFQD